jgi:hypothetical protein
VAEPSVVEAVGRIDEMLLAVVAETVDVIWQDAFAPGGYEVDVGDTGLAAFTIAPDDSRTLAAADRLLRDVVRRNRDAVDLVTDPADPSQIMTTARQVLDPVRQDGYRSGTHEVELEVDGGGATRFAFDLTDVQADLLRRYHHLLARVLGEGENREVFERLAAARADELELDVG